MKKNAHIFITALTFIVCASYLYINRSQLVLLQRVHAFSLIALCGLMAFLFSVMGYTFRMLLSLLGVRLNLSETLGLSFLTHFGNYLGPTSPGSVLKAVYLKKGKGLGFARFSSVFAVNNFLGVLWTGILGACLFFFMLRAGYSVPPVLFWMSLGLSGFAALPFFLRFSAMPAHGKFWEMLRAAAEGFNIMKAQRRKLLAISITYVIQLIMSAVMFRLIFSAMGFPINSLVALMISIYTSMVTYFPLTPGNLGIQEAAGAFIFSLFGADFTVGILGLGVYRAAHMAVAFLAAPFFIMKLFKDKKIAFRLSDRPC